MTENGQALKREVENEIDKFKHMSGRDRVWYIWEYYKFYILGVILVIMVFWVIGTIIYNSTFDTELYVVIFNDYSTIDEDLEVITNDFHDAMGWGKKEPVYTESVYISFSDDSVFDYDTGDVSGSESDDGSGGGSDDGSDEESEDSFLASYSEYTMGQMNYGTNMKVTALLAAKNLDVMITDPGCFAHYLSQGTFYNMDPILPADVKEALSDRLIYAENPDGDVILAAIDIAGTQFTDLTSIELKPAYFSLTANSERTENGIALLRYMLNL